MVLALAGCSRPGRTTRAFYFWKTTFRLAPVETEALARHRIQRLYLRLFDVAWDRAAAKAVPVGRLAFGQPVPEGLEVVPVVYLTNAVFEQGTEPVGLARQVWTLARAMAGEGAFVFPELQVDCDWTDSTREAFFAFCRALREQAAPVRLSATIRLHQVKYARRTGVPPVERGMLMFYNVGSLQAAPQRPSIFNEEDAGRYVAQLDAYPLPLDAVLPVFSWAVQGREGRVVGLLPKPDEAALGANPALTSLGPGRYRASAATLLRGAYLQEGDTLAVEAMRPGEARAAADLLARHFHPRSPFAIALFDLDERNLKAHGPEDLEALYSAVR